MGIVSRERTATVAVAFMGLFYQTGGRHGLDRPMALIVNGDNSSTPVSYAAAGLPDTENKPGAEWHCTKPGRVVRTHPRLGGFPERLARVRA